MKVPYKTRLGVNNGPGELSHWHSIISTMEKNLPLPMRRIEWRIETADMVLRCYHLDIWQRKINTKTTPVDVLQVPCKLLFCRTCLFCNLQSRNSTWSWAVVNLAYFKQLVHELVQRIWSDYRCGGEVALLPILYFVSNCSWLEVC